MGSHAAPGVQTTMPVVPHAMPTATAAAQVPQPLDDVTPPSETLKPKAQRLLGWAPTRSWRDYLDSDGRTIVK